MAPRIEWQLVLVGGLVFGGAIGVAVALVMEVVG